MVNAIFYLLQPGCQWRMLPRDFPPRSTVYGYFRAWIAAGVWAHVHDVLYRRTRELEGRDESPTAAIIDSQSVKTSAEAREMVGYDAGKRVKEPVARSAAIWISTMASDRTRRLPARHDRAYLNQPTPIPAAA